MSDNIPEWIQLLVAQRTSKNLSISSIESNMRIATGWINRIESGENCPLDLIFGYARAIDIDMDNFGSKLANSIGFNPGWNIVSVNDTRSHFHFDYAGHPASITIPASESSLRTAINNFVTTLNSHRKAIGVATGFIGLVRDLPGVNPAEIWGLIIQRLYTIPYSWEPANLSQGGDLSQSWKRSAGWALEEVVVRRYSAALLLHGITISKDTSDIREFSRHLGINESKPDVVLYSEIEQDEITRKNWIGALAVKASVAERRDDDVPWASEVMNAGLIVPYVTMDVKSYPGRAPSVDGEYKENWNGVGEDGRNAKRSDVEDDGVFSGVFSFNTNTIPTHSGYPQPGNRIFSIIWSNQNDELLQFILANS
jgi:hypothetical protein